MATTNKLWPTCVHGYYDTPSHHCPWCAGEDTSNFVHVVGKGNGWLLHKDELTCDGCGGPRGAGWGAWAEPEPPTPERVREALSTMKYCYSCVCEGKHMKRTADKGEALTSDEAKVLGNGTTCPDCGKRFVERGRLNCPRLTCGSRFEEIEGKVIRTTAARPDKPPPKYVEIG